MNSALFMLLLERWHQTAEEVFGCSDRSVSLRPRFSPKDPALRQILLLLTDELHNESGNGALYAEGLAGAALARLLQRHSTRSLSAQHTAPGLSQRQLNRVTDLIESNLGETIAVDDLAEASGVGPCYSPRIFCQSTGRTPYRFVLARRIERAQELLTGTNLPVVEIALAVDFSSQSHFTATFRKSRGITPAAYRRMN
jgi:AraC family transcriptional regulator